MAAVKKEYEVEQLFINNLKSLGYEYIQLKNYDDVKENFKIQLCRLNRDNLIQAKGEAQLSDAEFERVITHLEGHTVYESAKILRDKFVLTLDDNSTVYLSLISSDVKDNIYQVTHQITMDKAHLNDVVYKNRYDVTLLINGLPLTQIELKRSGVEIDEAINQINRYRKYSFKGLFRFIQFFVVSNGVQTKYFANCNEKDRYNKDMVIQKSLAFYWTDEKNQRINKLNDFANELLNKNMITCMMLDYMVIKQNEPVLMILRPYQVYSIRRSLQRVFVDNSNGYLFETPSSGKTVVSFKLAQAFRDSGKVDKVFFLVDRQDLDDQTVQEYNSFEPNCVNNTESTKELIEALSNSSKKMVVTTIQKLACALRSEKYEKVLKPYQYKKCVFIIDECHRSQFGTMHASVKRHFLNANYIGFTGTPIMEENKGATGKTTADLFNSGNLESCLYQYGIKEGIADGNILSMNVQYMNGNGKIDELKHIDTDKLDDPEYCKSLGIDINELYHDPKRIEYVSKDILKNFDRFTKPNGTDSFSAIFATDSIESLMSYYRCMKKYNDKNKRIAAIFTCQANSDYSDGQDENAYDYLSECINDYNEIFGTNFDVTTFDAYRKDVSARLKQQITPSVDLVIVVNMFLTGFDSKATNTLFLDKNLKYHNLLQAFSRTIRVDKPSKRCGQIISYRNIKQEQDDALRLFSGGGNPNDYLLDSYDQYVSNFRKYVELLKQVSPTPDVAGCLNNEDDQKQFVICFRSLANALGILKSFSRFTWDDLNLYMDEQEYCDYKSWYLDLYDKVRDPNVKTEYMELGDIDFQIELIRTDKINVVYIMNLLKSVNRKDKQEMSKSIDLIIKEIERSDNEKMRTKQSIMISFVKDRFPNLEPDEDIHLAYEEYENELLHKMVNDFAKTNNMDEALVLELLSMYLLDPESITSEIIRKKIDPMNLGLLKASKLTKNIELFLADMYNKFTAEGI